MRIGYAKGISILKRESANKEFCEKYKVDRIFADKHGEWIARREMINYLREGDEVVVEDITDISDSAGELIELLLQFRALHVHFRCEKRKIHTMIRAWEFVLAHLDAYGETPEPVKGRPPRFIEDLDDCIDIITKTCHKNLQIACEGNHEMAGIFTKFVGELEYHFIDLVTLEYQYCAKKTPVETDAMCQ